MNEPLGLGEESEGWEGTWIMWVGGKLEDWWTILAKSYSRILGSGCSLFETDLSVQPYNLSLEPSYQIPGLQLLLLNARSASNKADIIHGLMVDVAANLTCYP